MTTERYVHHGREVTVISAVKGQHRDHCLCFQGCRFFKPGQPDHCLIAAKNYALCVEHGLVTPVYECPEYQAVPAPPAPPHGTEEAEKIRAAIANVPWWDRAEIVLLIGDALGLSDSFRGFAYQRAFLEDEGVTLMTDRGVAVVVLRDPKLHDLVGRVRRLAASGSPFRLKSVVLVSQEDLHGAEAIQGAFHFIKFEGNK